MKEELFTKITITTDNNDSIEQNEKDFINAKLTHHEFNCKMAILINRVKRIESLAISFCDNQLATTCGDGYYYSFQAIAAQNSTHFKLNEKIKITAGTGAFMKKTNLVVKVNNKEILLNSDGVAEYEQNVGTSIGKHRIPVKIQYKRPDGELMSVEKEINYSVDQ